MGKMTIHSDTSAQVVFAECYAHRQDEMSQTELLSRLASWDVAVLETEVGIIGAVARKAGEFHFGILPAYRSKWATRSRMKQILDWAAESGQVHTSAQHGSIGERLARFVGMSVSSQTQKGSNYVLA